ncbi:MULTISPECIES: cysteine/O-acetylserine transporter [Pantoea]|uniref:cysteine/O-acetylserine transporter n=1 Tax=Pantoea TaxID=53335 RepID=UPI000DE20024|nr:cysteine/O-acetylserine transporter [Pantoea sp. 3_1284]RBO13682.1 cysteine/O-acetylserine transporter [Pantoea sp. 3_1284]
MPHEVISAFMTYTLITALTPGPNNILILNSVNGNGIKRSLPVLTGMGAGFLMVMVLCGIFALTLVKVLPAVTQWLAWAGAAYILWLALRIATSTSDDVTGSQNVMGFWSSFWLQFANVKIILYAITALSAFVLPYTHESSVIFMVSLILAIIGNIGHMTWALAGHLFQRVFYRHTRLINSLLALFLIYSALKMLI